MHSSIFALSAAVLGVQALPLGNNTTSTGTPCLRITKDFSKYAASNSSLPFVVGGELAQECLSSVPFDADRAVSFATEVKKYLQFQSTSEILENPPAGYLSPPTDLLGGINQIIAKAQDGQYRTELEFEQTLQSLFISAYDGHLALQPCLSQVFTFERQLSLVSVSADGVSSPELFTLNDAELFGQGDTCVSSIQSINGEDARDYLSKLSLQQGSQDPDARYNGLFPSVALNLTTGAGSGGFLVSSSFPGAKTILTHKNGTETTTTTVAKLPRGLEFNFKSGTDLFSSLCIPKTAKSSEGSSNTSTPEAKPIPASQAYPKPIVRDEFNFVSGYYLEDDKDVAVLVVPTFSVAPTTTTGLELPEDEPSVFSALAKKFVQQAKKDGKKKIIIDVSGNGGGLFSEGENFYKLFFPKNDAFTYTRFRTHEAINLIGKAFTSVPEKDVDSQFLETLDANAAVTPDQKSNFASWDDLYGPEKLETGNYSKVYANGNLTLDSTKSLPILGYGAAKGQELPQQPFETEDILILTDGYCASTCASFVNFMKNFAGVKSLVLGGRPQHGPMQAVGGVKGSQALEFSDIDKYVSSAQSLLQNNTSIFTVAEQKAFNRIEPVGMTRLPILATGGVNFRNAYRPSEQEMPLQFVYEAADCRLFYTYETLTQPAKAWSAAAKAMWGGGKCVEGSRNGQGSVSAGGVPGFETPK